MSRQSTLLIMAGLLLGSAALTGESAMGQGETTNAKVEAAFEAVRGGDLSRTRSLQEFGSDIVGDIEPYLSDPNEDVRREAVALLASFEDEAASSALVAAVDDDNADIRERAARGVLTGLLKFGEGAVADAGAAVVTAEKQGQLSGSALMLLAYSQQGDAILRKALNDDRLVETSDAGPAVPASVVAQLCLSRRGDNDARSKLHALFADGDTAILRFALQNIAVIDSPALLHGLAAATFGNETPTGDGVPTGAEPSRRVADEAVIAFVGRLSLSTDFAVEDQIRFTPEQIESVQDAVANAVPQ